MEEGDLRALETIFAQFEASFHQWVQAITTRIQGVIAIDGKTSRRTHDHTSLQKGASPRKCVGRRKPLGVGSTGAPREKSNEITAIPLLLQQLALEGCIVTIDAMGTQTKIAQQIIEQQGEYVLARKREPWHPLRRGASDVYHSGQSDMDE